MPRTSRSTRRARETSYDAGTLWTMRRHHCVARCALHAHQDEWEIRVVIDGQSILTKRCDATAQVFEFAREWKVRMTGRGWTPVDPRAPLGEQVA